jgi:hypothetical protein
MDNKSKPAKISFSMQVPETFDHAGYEALEWTELGGVELKQEEAGSYTAETNIPSSKKIYRGTS